VRFTVFPRLLREALVTRYRPYSRREFRRRFANWARRNVRLIAGLTAGLAVLVAVETFLLVGVGRPGPVSWWLLGIAQAGMVALYLHLLHNAYLANDREAIRHLRGAWGEDNTRSELQIAKRRRFVWGWVDSITLQNGDIDHLVITRRGGLVAIDTKWRTDTHDVIDMARAAHRAKSRAEALAQTVLTRERGARHRSKGNPLTVTPVVVLWGAAQHTIPEGAQHDGIDFIPGRSLRRWLTTLDSEPVSKTAAADLIQRLERFGASAWANARG
jgi:hypothetical protein